MNIKQKLFAAGMAASMGITMISSGSVFAGHNTDHKVGTVDNPFNRATNNLKQAGKESGIETTKTLPQIVGGIINVFLGILGIVFLVLAIYAGYKWMTAQGEEKAVTDAKTTLTNSIIGLIIIAGAYAISDFVIKGIFDAVSQ